jgi:hypothetical protein
LLQRQAFVLALEDAFDFSLVVVVLAIIAVLFVRQTRRQARVPQVAPGQDERAEEIDASRLVLVE